MFILSIFSCSMMMIMMNIDLFFTPITFIFDVGGGDGGGADDG